MEEKQPKIYRIRHSFPESGKENDPRKKAGRTTINIRWEKRLNNGIAIWCEMATDAEFFSFDNIEARNVFS